MISFRIVAARFDSILIRVDMFVHQTWKESRLKLPNDIFEEGDDYVTLPPEFFDNMWQPDPYILNSKVAGEFGGGEVGACEPELSLTICWNWFIIRENKTHHANMSEIATLTHKFSSVTLYKNKTVRYAARMHAIIACQMEFQL